MLIKDIKLKARIYLPGIIILFASLLALNASVLLMNKHEALYDNYEMFIQEGIANKNHIVALKKDIIISEKKLFWFVWGLGLAGFVLVLMNADKLRRLAAANQEKATALEVLEEQLVEIQKAQSEKEALQGQLYQAQKLEAVGRLAGGIAHDFNNILAAMNGYAEFLQDDLPAESDQHQFASNILTAGHQARELVDKMLAFSRLDRNETKQMYLKDSIEESLSMLKASLPKTVEVEADIEDENFIIHGSPTLISQAVMNLAVNAKDALNNNKGRLMINLAKADMSFFEDMPRQDNLPATDDMPLVAINEVTPNHNCLMLGTLARDQDYMCLSIADNGTGMSRVIMEHIFEPFFTTKAVDKGTGLGLAMVHGVIASHRGAMQINSIIGKGTRFDLLFPVLGEKEKITGKAHAIDAMKACGNVLLVEDQKEVRDMMHKMLERLGFEVESCNNALAALEIIREHPEYFSVIVTDQNMPKMTGLELIEQVGIDNPDLPFVLVTGYSLEKMRDLMKEHVSVKAILRKPVEREKLMEAVQTAILEKQFAA